MSSSILHHLREFLSGLNAFQDSLQCSICLDTLKNPVRTKCGHRYCQFCLHKVIDEGTAAAVKCPNCNTPRITKRGLARDEEGILLVGSLDEIKRAFAEDCGGILRFGDHPFKLEEMSGKVPAVATESSSPANIPEGTRNKGRRTRLSRKQDPPAPKRAEQKGKPASEVSDGQKNGDRREEKDGSGRPEPRHAASAATSTRNKEEARLDPFVRVHRLRAEKGAEEGASNNISGQASMSERKKNRIVFQLKGRTWVDPDRLAVKSGKDRRRVALFVQLGRLAKEKDHFQRYPSLSDILAKRRRSCDGSGSASISRGGDLDANVSAWLEGSSGGRAAKNQGMVWSGDHPDPKTATASGKANVPSGQEKATREVITAAPVEAANNFYPPSDDVYYNPEPSTSKPFDPFYFEEEPETPKTHNTRRRTRRVSKDKIINTVLKESKRSSENSLQTKSRSKTTTKLNMKQVCKALTPKDLEDVENVSIRNSDSLDAIVGNDEDPNEAKKKTATKRSYDKKIVRTGSEFTRKIVGQDKDLYSSDEETSSQREKRMDKQREEDQISREVILEEGRLQSKRRIIRAPRSSSSEQSAVSPRKDIFPGASSASASQSSQGNQASIRKYLKAGSLSGSTETKPREAAAAAAEANSASSYSSQRFSTHPSESALGKSTLRAIENIPRSETSIVDFAKSKTSNNNFEHEPEEEYVEEELPDIESCLESAAAVRTRQSISCASSNASTEDSELDGTTQEISHKILQLEKAEKLKRKRKMSGDDDNFMSKSLLGSSSQTSMRPHKVHPDADSSDDDMFGSTPQSKRKRIRRISQNSSTRQLEQVREEALPQTTTASLTDTFCEEEFAQEQKSYVLLSTGLNLASREAFAAFLKKFGSETRANLDGSVTHVVVGCSHGLHAERTLKYLQAVAMGKSIVSADWITDCMKRNALLPTDPYEPQDETGVEGPKKSRLAKAENRPGLFSGFEFFLKDNFKLIPKDQLKQLLQLCGGTVLRTASLFSYNKGTTALVIVDKDSGSTTQEESLRTFLEYDVAVIDKDWVIECVATYSVKPIWESLQHDCSEEDLVKAGYRDRALFESQLND